MRELFREIHTLTLSLGEREPQIVHSGFAFDLPANPATRNFKPAGRVSPFPWGESWGEGETSREFGKGHQHTAFCLSH
jgi:hypothetical protein